MTPDDRAPADPTSDADAPVDHVEAPPAFGRLFGPLFWLVISVSIACIAAGVLVGLDGPRLFPPRAWQRSHVRPWQSTPRPLNSAAHTDEASAARSGQPRRARLWNMATRPL
jgi:hypothetical protein